MALEFQHLDWCLHQFGHAGAARKRAQVGAERVHKRRFQPAKTAFSGHGKGVRSRFEHKAVHPSRPRHVDDAGKVVLYRVPCGTVLVRLARGEVK